MNAYIEQHVTEEKHHKERSLLRDIDSGGGNISAAMRRTSWEKLFQLRKSVTQMKLNLEARACLQGHLQGRTKNECNILFKNSILDSLILYFLCVENSIYLYNKYCLLYLKVPLVFYKKVQVKFPPVFFCIYRNLLNLKSLTWRKISRFILK